MLRGVWAIVYKELLQVKRDPGTRIVFLIPIIQTFIFGFAIDMDVQKIATVVWDMDRSTESRRLLESLENTRTFRIVKEVGDEKSLRREIVAGRARVGFVVPPDYSADILNGRKATAQVLIDGSDSTVALNAMQSARAVSFLQSFKEAGISINDLAVDVRPRVLFNPDLVSSHFYVPGLIGTIMQIVTMILTAFAIVRERERGTLEQLVVTPVSKNALVIGKLLPYAVLGMMQTGVVLVLMRVVFGVVVEGDVLLLLALSVLFLLPSLAMGMLISTVSTNQAQAMQLSVLIILPSVLLSGFAFPRETMPAPIYLLTFLIPVTYYIQILRGVILRGAGFMELWPQALILFGFTVALLTVSSMRFQKRLK